MTTKRVGRLLTRSCVGFVAACVVPIGTALGALSNSQLLQEAARAADRNDWVAASEHLFAYIQRDPERMLVDTAHANAIRRALADVEENARRSVAGVDGKFDCVGCDTPAATLNDVAVPRPERQRVGADSLATLRKFVGSYTGRNDGRRARMSISMPNPNQPMLSIVLRDLDRNVEFRGRHRANPAGPQFAHILRDVRLRRTTQGEGKVFELLLLHTWNDDYISGVTVWRGREFGATFERL